MCRRPVPVFLLASIFAAACGGASSTAGQTVVVTGGGLGACNGSATQLFPPGAPWNRAIDAAGLDAESGTIIAFLAANRTASARFQITFDFNILFADCDTAPVPVPSIGRLEGEATYACASDGDCHLTVVDPSTCRLHELWRANLTGGTSSGAFTSGCQAVWDLTAVPPATGRGDFCNSADAAGLPIVPMVFTADEVASGTFTAATDALTARKWSEVGVDSASLKGLFWSDFEVVELGTRIDWGSGNCSRTPITR
jgi:hypothetical protein